MLKGYKKKAARIEKARGLVEKISIVIIVSILLALVLCIILSVASVFM